MTLIEGREVLQSRILGKRSHELDTGPFDESGSEEEYLIANEGYPEDGEDNNNRDFFSLPTLGLNYLNNLNLNINLNLRNSSLWRMYENTSFTKPGFFSNYLGKHTEGLDINEHDITPDSRGFFTLTNFLRRHGFHSYEDEYSEEAVLERVRFQKLQEQAAIHSRKYMSEDSIYALHEHNTRTSLPERENIFDFDDSTYGSDKELLNPVNIEENLANKEILCKSEVNREEMRENVSYESTLNPFYNRVELSLWDKIKIGIFTVIFLPIKLVLMISTLCLALVLVLVGMYGVTFEESQSAPLTKWRRAIRWIIANVVMRGFVFFSGFIWKIKETGKRATPEEAPIFVVAPHSSYFDAFVVILLGAPSVVAKLSTKDIPVFGRLVTFTQAVYVSRESKGSRRQTVELLKQRAQGVYNGSGMPQIFIFPEGTCSNRSSLIKFKPGAFVPQVPVQPVVVRYPNKFDAVTWTFDGPSVKQNIWCALSQFYLNMEIEYLPVYVPNEAEKNDPTLFSENVRKVMSEALQIPMSNYQFEDGMLMGALRDTQIIQKLRNIHRAKKALALVGCSNESTMIHQGSRYVRSFSWRKSFLEFQREFFNVDSEDTSVPEVQAVFKSFTKNDEDNVDVRPYLALACLVCDDRTLLVDDMQQKLYQMYNTSNDDTEDVIFRKLIGEVFEVSEEEEIKSPNGNDQSHAAGDDASARTDALRHRLVRCIELAKLFADEVTERLPKPYPSRQDRDKLPKKLKQKSD
ncbi:1-acylglycerophosphocholine O-acyltransferase 1 [Orchesella cincta]|uniref:1-acylglycerophosphocholine O-acyltransferase 1 n=1 Tax=Orchesella cincta TaxID=48709 RepID=A0A1D2NIA0_ORCCI|nr:1-acylglycerophosphocholine O-acyltransferase 1 [Orchesella cincta]